MRERTLDRDITDLVDAESLRREVKEECREVASDPHAQFHFHTGRAHALRMGYPVSPLDQLPDEATDAFAAESAR